MVVSSTSLLHVGPVITVFQVNVSVDCTVTVNMVTD